MQEKIIELYEKVAIGVITPNQAREGFNKFIKEIIGEDEKLSVHDECDTYLDQGGWVCNDHNCWANYKDKDTKLTEPPYYDSDRPSRNYLRQEQKERAGLGVK